MFFEVSCKTSKAVRRLLWMFFEECLGLQRLQVFLGGGPRGAQRSRTRPVKMPPALPGHCAIAHVEKALIACLSIGCMFLASD